VERAARSSAVHPSLAHGRLRPHRGLRGRRLLAEERTCAEDRQNQQYGLAAEYIGLTDVGLDNERVTIARRY
jgi:hypothetical protein